jgi:hypothetical protein
LEKLEREKLRKKTYYATKLRRATQMLFFKHHRKPGVKGWELKKRLGPEYPKIIRLLDKNIEKLDLTVKTVFEEGSPPEKPTKEQLDRARFYITLRGDLKPKDAKMMGWRIDDIAGLTVIISTILAKRGRASRKDVETLLKRKFPSWKVNSNIERYIRSGYIDQDEKGQLYLDWRTRAEVDEKTLIDSLLQYTPT